MRRFVAALLIGLVVTAVVVALMVYVILPNGPVTHLAFYDSQGAIIGEGDFVFPRIAGDAPSAGRWRFQLASTYVSPKPGYVSAGDMLSRFFWHDLRSVRMPDGGIVVNLHPTGSMDWVFLYPDAADAIRSGKWGYETDAGLVEGGRFSAR